MRDIDPTQTLTSRERDVLELLATGATNAEIAGALSLAEGTVRNAVARLTGKLGVADRTQLALLAVRAGLGQSDSKLA
jgi:DNA-binding NarL/FixJ family response regulator